MNKEEKVFAESRRLNEQFDENQKVKSDLKNQIKKNEKEIILFLKDSDKLPKLYTMVMTKEIFCHLFMKIFR